MDKKLIARKGVEMLTSMSVGVVTANAIAATTPADQNLYYKVMTKVGGFVIGSMVGAAAIKHVNEQIDTTIESVKEATTPEI